MNSPNDTTLTDLLTRARQGDHDCLNRVFTECRHFLQLSARARLEHWLQAKVDASDVVQQTLLEAYRDFGRFRGESEAEWFAWLRQILANNIANYIRFYRDVDKRCIGKEVSLHAGNGSAAELQPPSPGTSPSMALIRKEREVQLADALAELPADYREVIWLRNLQRLSFQETADRMGRSRPAVQMLWMRALGELKKILKQRDSDFVDG